MPEDPLRSAIDAIRTRLHDELDAQLAHLSSRRQEELEAARRSAEAEAEQRWASRVESVRSEGAARLESEVAAARAEAERRMVAESMRLRVEAEQAAAESAAAVREELEQALAHERERAQAEIAGERERLEAERAERQGALDAAHQELERIRQERDSLRQELDRARQESERFRDDVEQARQQLESTRQQLEPVGQELEASRRQLEAMREQLAAESRELDTSRTELDAARRARDEATHAHQTLTFKVDQERRAREAEAQRQAEQAQAIGEARVAERQAQLAVVERLLAAIRSMDAGRSLTDVLAALTAAAAAEAPRVALFVVNGSELRGWKAVGFETDTPLQAGTDPSGLLGEALRRREPVVTAADAGPAAPGFAALPADRAAMAVPLLVGAQPVAVLYADDGADGTPASPASWPEAIQILGRHASVNLAHLTAARAAEVMRRSMGTPAGEPKKSPEDGTSARRYARLLVSEIKLYNEAAVRLGRQKGDLLERLKPEIERARKLYTQRISPAVDARGALFQQELVQTLADGDASLLGNPA